MSSDEDDTWERPESAETVLEVGKSAGRALDRSEAIYPAGPGVRVAAGDSASSSVVASSISKGRSEPTELRDTYLQAQERLFSGEVYARRQRQEQERRKREVEERQRLREQRERDRAHPPAAAPESPVHAPDPPQAIREARPDPVNRASNRQTQVAIQSPPLVLRDGVAAENGEGAEGAENNWSFLALKLGNHYCPPFCYGTLGTPWGGQ